MGPGDLTDWCCASLLARLGEAKLTERERKGARREREREETWKREREKTGKNSFVLTPSLDMKRACGKTCFREVF